MNIIPHLDNPLAGENIIDDKAMLATKNKVMDSMRWNSLLSSVSTIGSLIGGTLFAGGIIGLANALFKEAAVTSAGAATTGALAAIGGAPVVAMLAVGALFVGVSVVSTYVASRIWQSKQFDNLEVNAASTAHHLVQELKSNNMCMIVEEPAHAQGKKWAQHEQARREAMQQQAVQL